MIIFWIQTLKPHVAKLFLREDLLAAEDEKLYVFSIALDKVFHRAALFVYLKPAKSFWGEIRDILSCLTPTKLHLWQSEGDCFDGDNTLTTPLCYLWKLFSCTHLQNCLSEENLYQHNKNNNKVVIDSLSFVSYKLPFKVTVIAPCCVMQIKV